MAASSMAWGSGSTNEQLPSVGGSGGGGVVNVSRPINPGQQQNSAGNSAGGIRGMHAAPSNELHGSVQDAPTTNPEVGPICQGFRIDKIIMLHGVVYKDMTIPRGTIVEILSCADTHGNKKRKRRSHKFSDMGATMVVYNQPNAHPNGSTEMTKLDETIAEDGQVAGHKELFEHACLAQVPTTNKLMRDSDNITQTVLQYNLPDASIVCDMAGREKPSFLSVLAEDFRPDITDDRKICRAAGGFSKSYASVVVYGTCIMIPYYNPSTWLEKGAAVKPGMVFQTLVPIYLDIAQFSTGTPMTARSKVGSKFVIKLPPRRQEAHLVVYMC